MKKKIRILAFLCAFVMICTTLSGCSLIFSGMSPDKIKAYSYEPKITEEMPIIRINTEDGSNKFAIQYKRQDKLDDLIEYVDATVTVENCEKEYLMENAEAEVKVRGNYTLEYPKKPLRIKFGEKQNMLGLNDGGEFKNWVLLADWKDLSMSNNTVAYYLGNVILGSDGYYCTDFRNVEVYLNGTYWGVYLLVEQQEVKDGRMSIPEVEDDYTGTDIGYCFEYDTYYTEERNMPNDSGDPTFEVEYFNTPNMMPGYTVKSDIYDDSQLEFISSYVENAYKIAYSAVKLGLHYEFNDTYTDIVEVDSNSVKDTVSKVIDIQSLADMYIINEICCNPDIAWSSFYLSLDMTEDGSKKLIFDAPWDYDSAFGIKAGFTDNDKMYAAGSNNPWFKLLAKEYWFMDIVEAKWAEMKLAKIPEKTLTLIEEQKNTYAEHYARNYEKWEERVKKGNFELTDEVNSFRTQGEAADYLYNWLEERFEYLDSQWS